MTFGLFVGLAMLLLVAVAVLLTLDHFRSDSASDSTLSWTSGDYDAPASIDFRHPERLPKDSILRHDYGDNIWTN